MRRCQRSLRGGECFDPKIKLLSSVGNRLVALEGAVADQHFFPNASMRKLVGRERYPAAVDHVTGDSFQSAGPPAVAKDEKLPLATMTEDGDALLLGVSAGRRACLGSVGGCCPLVIRRGLQWWQREAAT